MIIIACFFQGKIAKDARECAQECVSEFISFITSEASDRCQVRMNFKFFLKAKSGLRFTKLYYHSFLLLQSFTLKKYQSRTKIRSKSF